MQMVVKKGLLAAAAVLGMSGFAAAADMAVKAVAPAPYLYDWSGIYVGGVVGGAWGTHDLSDPGLGIVGTLVGAPVVQTNNPSAFIGGVEIGSRYQFGKLVVGWEGDVTWGDINNTSTACQRRRRSFRRAAHPLAEHQRQLDRHRDRDDRYRSQQLAALWKGRRGC